MSRGGGSQSESHFFQNHTLQGVIEELKYDMFSDEQSSTLFPTTAPVYMLRHLKEAVDTDCLLPTVEHGGGSLMIEGVGELYVGDCLP